MSDNWPERNRPESQQPFGAAAARRAAMTAKSPVCCTICAIFCTYRAIRESFALHKDAMMSPLPVRPLQVALLFDNSRAFEIEFSDWNRLLDGINTYLEGKTAPFDFVAGATNGTAALLSNGTIHINLGLWFDPMPTASFAGPLDAPYYTKMRPELVQGVMEHRHAVLVEVGLGPVPIPQDYGDASVAMARVDVPQLQDQATFELRLIVAQMAALTICEAAMPSVVHWGQSDQLLDGPGFCKLAESGFCLPLYVYPGFSGSGRKEGESYCMAVDAYGAHHLIGAHVRFEEHPQAMAHSYHEVLAFIAYCRSIGRILEEHETFGSETGETIEVRHTGPSERHPWGEILLRKRVPGERPHRPRLNAPVDDGRLRAAFLGHHNALSGKDSPGPRARIGTAMAVGLRGSVVLRLFRALMLAGVVFFGLGLLSRELLPLAATMTQMEPLISEAAPRDIGMVTYRP